MSYKKGKHIAVEKPHRGRDLKTREVPGGTQGGELEYYHEGYQDGKLYHEPDNLGMMKNLVNLRLEQKVDDRGTRLLEDIGDKRDTEKELFNTELDKMYVKLRDIDDFGSFDSGERKTDNESKKQKEPDESTRNSVESKIESEKSSTESIDARERKSTIEGVTLPMPSTDSHTTRFLMSGHVREEGEPTFIIQQYSGPSPFVNKSLDFSLNQTEGNAEVFIAGRFYQDCILEEINNVPKSLQVKPEKILIGDGSRLYEKSFRDRFDVGQYYVDFEGKFIKNELTGHYTPCVRIDVLNSSTVASRYVQGEVAKTPTTAFLSRPVSQNPFDEVVGQHHIPGDRIIRKYKLSEVPSVYQPPSTSNSEGEIIVCYNREGAKSSLASTSSDSSKRAMIGAEYGDVPNELLYPTETLVYRSDVTGRKLRPQKKSVLRRISQVLFNKELLKNKKSISDGN